MYILSLICCFVKDQLMKFRKQENKKSIQGLFFRPGGNSTLIWGVCVGGGGLWGKSNPDLLFRWERLCYNTCMNFIHK